MPKVASQILMFWPEGWSQLDRFSKFMSSTYSFTDRQYRELSGVRAHFEKAGRLISIATDLRPTLSLDAQEFETKGFTAGERGNAVATLIEAGILEFYSSIDCTAKVLRAIYGKKVGGAKGSTRSLFQGLQSVGADLEQAAVPTPIARLIASARWYRRLLSLRDELTHTGTGHVRLEDDGITVSYVHYGLKEGDASLDIADVFHWLDEVREEINAFLGGVFHHLNEGLNDEPVWQMCGMSEGRMLYRWVSPVGEITFNSGECGAYVWFDQPGETPCPFRENCGAYQNKAPKARFGTGGGPDLE